MKKVLVTGATGFVGMRLCEVLHQRGYQVRAALRTDQALPGCVEEKIVVGEINAQTNWTAAVDGVESVVHCAALAHALGDQSALSRRYQECNAHGSLALAQACAGAGIGRLVYLSSIKVNGEKNRDVPFSRLDRPNPGDAYANSKLEAEMGIADIVRSSLMSAAIVRSPLVYGPNVRANFLRLMRWIDTGVPIPLGSVRNSRSLVSIWNLCDLIDRLLSGPISKIGTFMISDGEDLSTPELIRRIAVAMDRPARLLPIPFPILRVLGVLSGRGGEFERLCGSLTVDITATCSDLGWRPPITVDEGLSRTVRWYLSRNF